MTATLRGTVTGFGRMGMTHFSILNSHPDVEFVGVCDPTSYIRRNVEKHLNVEGFSDHNRMLDKTQPDFSIIATPTGLHAGMASDAISRGVHVFVEKPFTMSLEHGQQLLDQLDGSEIVNQIGYVLRFSDVFMTVRELLESGALGELYTFRMEMYGPTILRDNKSGWRAEKAQGGGCLHDFASHAVDLVCYLFGAPDEIRGTVLQNIYSQHVEDAVHTTMVFGSGLTGSLSANWSEATYRKPANRLELLGENGKLIADLHEMKLFFRREPMVEGYSQGWNTRYVTELARPVRMYLRGYEFTRQLDYFVDKVESRNQDNVAGFSDGQVTDEVIGRIIEDAGQSGY